MAVTDYIAGEIATEVLMQLFAISRKAWRCKNTSKQLIALIDSLYPTIYQIRYRGMELPDHHQAQIGLLFETLEKCLKITNKLLKYRQWNLYRQLTLARKMEKLEKIFSSFLKAEIFTHILCLRADSVVRLSYYSSSSSCDEVEAETEETGGMFIHLEKTANKALSFTTNEGESSSTLSNKEVVDNRPCIERTPTILVKSGEYLVPNDVVAVGGGIEVVRPPVLKPPPSMKRPPIDLQGSSWDFLTLLAPSETVKRPSSSSSSSSSENGCDEDTGGMFIQLWDTADEACSFTTNEGVSSRIVSNTSPIYSSGGSIITSWQKGQLLGRGSFGSVYEGISEDGDLFDINEVSLLDQGSHAQECIQQLEAEIALLSQLQRQNIMSSSSSSVDSDSTCSLVTPSLEFPDRISFREMDLSDSSPTGDVVVASNSTNRNNFILEIARQLQRQNIMSSSSSSVDSDSTCSFITPSLEFPDRISFRKMDFSEAGPSGIVAVQ